MQNDHNLADAGSALEAEPRVGKRTRFNYSSMLDFLSTKLMLVLVFLLPILFSWNPSVADEVAKRALIAISVLTALLLWLLARLQDGRYFIPRNPILGGAAALALVGLLATAFSPVVRESLVGVGLEGGTLATLLLSLITLWLVSMQARERKQLLHFYLALGASALLLFVIKLFHVAFGLSLGALLTTPSDNFLGKWNDLGLFFGLTLTLCLACLELLTLSFRSKILFRILLTLSAIGVLFVNFSLAWILVAVLALMTLVYKFSLRIRHGTHHSLMPDRTVFTSASAILIALAVVAFFGSGLINRYLLNPLRLGGIDVRPSWSSTYDITKATLKENLLVGVGLNRFQRAWAEHKPAGVNETIFWSADFNTGVGLVPTYAVTAGLLGLLGWVAFLMLFLWYGLRSLFVPHSDHLQQSLRYLAFAGSLYLWLVAFFYVPDAVLWLLAFIFTGFLVASHAKEKERAEVEVLDATHDPRMSFASILTLVALIVLNLGSGYLLVQRYRSLARYQNALYAYALTGDTALTEQKLRQAIAIDDSQDSYYRLLTDVHLLKLQQLIGQATGATSQEVLRQQFQTMLSEAIADATKATKLNQYNYLNWISLARVYEAVVPLKIEGAYDLARQAYERAAEVNPTTPLIDLQRARLELAKGDKKAARLMIAAALKQKPNYTEAIFLLSQLEYAEGNLKAAILNAEQVALLAPQDIGVFFQLGFLKYLQRDYLGAIVALERARELNPQYSNAKYFLGISYSMRGEIRKAIKEFEEIAALNPDNAEVKTILSNLRSGNAALAGIGAPANTPEKRPSLPVAEEKKSPRGN